MALRSRSLFLYGFEVTENNRSVDFQAAPAGPELNATLRLGFYSLTALLAEMKFQMESVDPADNTYTFVVDRTVSAGTQNRINISTDFTFLSINFATGSRATTSVASLIAFVGDQTGATSYSNSASAGFTLLTEREGYNYLSPDFGRDIFGSVNISASGIKEAIVHSIQKFWQVQFKFIPEAKHISEWLPLMEWLIQQKLFEFTPEVTVPGTFFEGTLESTPASGKGLGFRHTEMLPAFPFFYDTGLMRFRVNEG